MDAVVRMDLERRILRRFVEDVIREGHKVVVFDGEAESAVLSSVEAVMAEAMATDEDKLYVYRPDGSVNPIGFALFVYGNDGYDVLAEHSVSNGFEALCKGANELSNQLCEEYGGK